MGPRERRSPRRARAGREFPVLGTTQPASDVSRNRYFATAPSARITEADEMLLTAPGDVFHAKTMGTTMTACGLNASSWPKLWGKTFSRSLGPNCRQCLRATTQRPE